MFSGDVHVCGRTQKSHEYDGGSEQTHKVMHTLMVAQSRMVSGISLLPNKQALETGQTQEDLSKQHVHMSFLYPRPHECKTFCRTQAEHQNGQ